MASRYPVPNAPMALASLFSANANGEPFSVIVTFDRGGCLVEILNGRLTKNDVARRLQTTGDGVAYLVKKKLLKPLAEPVKNQQKFFEAMEFYRLMQDPNWLRRVTAALYQYVTIKKATAKVTSKSRPVGTKKAVPAPGSGASEISPGPVVKHEKAAKQSSPEQLHEMPDGPSR